MKKQYDAIMRAAIKRVGKMDSCDGSVANHQCDLALRTVMSALECAINMCDWGVVGEAQAMLMQIELKYRPADQKAGGPFLMPKS